MKILIVKKCDECRNRVLIEETSWNNGRTTKIGEAFCSEITHIIENKHGQRIKTYPDIPKWCPLEDFKEANEYQQH